LYISCFCFRGLQFIILYLLFPSIIFLRAVGALMFLRQDGREFLLYGFWWLYKSVPLIMVIVSFLVVQSPFCRGFFFVHGRWPFGRAHRSIMVFLISVDWWVKNEPREACLSLELRSRCLRCQENRQDVTISTFGFVLGCFSGLCHRCFHAYRPILLVRSSSLCSSFCGRHYFCELAWFPDWHGLSLVAASEVWLPTKLSIPKTRPSISFIRRKPRKRKKERWYRWWCDKQIRRLHHRTSANRCKIHVPVRVKQLVITSGRYTNVTKLTHWWRHSSYIETQNIVVFSVCENSERHRFREFR